MQRLYLPALIWLMFSFQVHAGNAAETEQTENQIVAPTIIKIGGAVDGEFALDVAGQQIAAAYLPQTLGEPRGAIIFFHDRSAQFDSPLIRQLRQQLTTYGWDTLTISLDYQIVAATEEPEMQNAVNPEPDAAQPADTNPQTADEPVETDGATNSASAAENTVDLPVLAPANPARMDAALAWLQSKNPARVIFVGHGEGAQTAVNTLAATPQPINALVLLSADKQITADTIIDANLPVLDVIGSQSADSAKQAALLRNSQLKLSATQPYSQRQLNAADRNFQGMEKQLGKRIHSWLYRQLIDR